MLTRNKMLLLFLAYCIVIVTVSLVLVVVNVGIFAIVVIVVIVVVAMFDAKLKSLLSFSFCFVVYLKVVCTEQNIIGKAEKGNNVTIYWSLNVTKRTYTTATLRFDKIVVSTCKAAGGNGFTCVTPKNDKYEASFNKTDKQITLTILNLTYSDSGDYLAELDYKDGKKTRPERLTTTTIQVRGMYGEISCSN